MRILKFTLSGNSAFFKKPDVNAIAYFTYGNIHKMVLCGICGAILGYGGYNQMSLYNQSKKKNPLVYPEFYEKLKNLKIAIIPNNSRGFFSKKIQYFNNSVGYASKEEGGNLIVKEQWLENPSWEIYIQINNSVEEELENYIVNRRSIYTPYLGKNDHLANIDNIYVYSDDEITIVKNPKYIDSLFKERDFEFSVFDDDDDEEEVYVEAFKYQEELPVELEKETNRYLMDKFVFTNISLHKISEIEVYKLDNKQIVFY